MNIGFLLAAGVSARFSGDKLFENINGQPVIYNSLMTLEQSGFVDEIFIAANKNNLARIKETVKKGHFKKVKKIIIGGKTRFKTVQKLVKETNAEKADFFIIHNAANPLAGASDIKACISECTKRKTAGAAAGRKIKSTVKEVSVNKEKIVVEKTLDRDFLWETETPQVVNAKIFRQCCRRARGDFSDDLAVLEKFGHSTCLVETSGANKKITTPEDLTVYKIGIGEDSHRFRVKGRGSSLMLGGVKINKLPALEADSDGDVILHSLCNAISSAIGGKSLGSFATEMCSRGIKDSKKYMNKILGDMRKNAFCIESCSVSLECSKPKIDPLSGKIKESLGKILGISEEVIGVTATSGNGLTPFGKGQAVKCAAAVLLKKTGDDKH